jgi:hypothetical protein
LVQKAPEDVKERRSAPEDVRELRNAWESQVGHVKGLTWELEQDFRFGQRITRTDQGYVMGGTMKGGSSSMWYPTGRDEYHAFKRWQTAEGVQEARNDEAFDRFTKLVGKHAIELVTRRRAPTPMRRSKRDPEPYRGYGPLYADMADILECLPASHLDRPQLRRIQLGGWGPDAAKASAYVDGAVLMYDFACRGARRTFLGLFLHEVGHAHEVALSEPQKDVLHEGYQVLAEEDAFIGIEFLVDANTRKLYQKFVFQEFLAETYMIYVACGQGLRDRIQRYGKRARGAWETIYEVFRESFDGIEYE